MKNWGIILISLFVACFVWVLHALSLNYSAYFQYKVIVNTDLVGYSSSAEANETMLLRGKASGYYILRARGFHGKPMELPITIDSKFFVQDDRIENSFILFIDEIRDKIVESLDESISIDFFDTDFLTFRFDKQNYRKVPVVPVANISLNPQYMQTSDITVQPDSILIYGPEYEISSISEIKTKPISLQDLDKSAHGFVPLDLGKVVKSSNDNVHYTIRVDRYVESSRKISISVVNTPKGKDVLTIPSEVTVTCRIPFASQSISTMSTLSLVVDYNDLVASKGSKIIPQLVKDNDCTIYSYTLSPNIVECIIVENR